ncbi:MAG: phosphatase PAP2 family protein [Anaerolineaceae bacterium]
MKKMPENQNLLPTDTQEAPQTAEERSIFQRFLKVDAHLSARLLVKETPGLLRWLLIILGHSCDSWYWLIFLSLLLFFGNADVRARTLFWIFGLIGLAAFVLALKFIIRRPRPEGEWGRIYRVSDPHSFPSGHAARAAGIAVMIGTMASALVIAGLGAWALGVGLSRVALKLHYLSDVVVGWMIGILCGAAAVWIFPLVEPSIMRLMP